MTLSFELQPSLGSSVFSLVAFLLSLASLALLYYCWRQSAAQPLFTVLAWLMMAATFALWIQGNGVIFGVCFALIVLSIQAWALIVFLHRPRAKKNIPTRARVAIDWQAAVKLLPAQMGFFIASVPLAGLAAMQLTTVATGWLSWSRVDLMALGIYTMPVVWGGLSFWVLADTRWWRPCIALVLICVVCSWGIYR